MIGFPLDSYVTYGVDGTPIFDRAISSEPYRKLLKTLFTSGVLPNVSTNLQVVADEGLTLKVLSGFAMVNGCMKLQETDETVTLEDAHTSLNRIDTIVMRLNTNIEVRSCELAVIKGTPATNPVAPQLNRSASMYDIGLANVTVNKNATVISQSSINDTRYDVDRCGVISSLSQFDTSTLYAQIQTDLTEFKTESEGGFNTWSSEQMSAYESFISAGEENFTNWVNTVTGNYNTWITDNEQDFVDWQNTQQSEFVSWFSTIRNILDEETAGHLQNEIEDLQSDLENTRSDLEDSIDELGTLVDTDKMDKVNPTGTGAISVGRKEGSTVGLNSTAIGRGAIATGEGAIYVGEDFDNNNFNVNTNLTNVIEISNRMVYTDEEFRTLKPFWVVIGTSESKIISSVNNSCSFSCARLDASRINVVETSVFTSVSFSIPADFESVFYITGKHNVNDIRIRTLYCRTPVNVYYTAPETGTQQTIPYDKLTYAKIPSTLKSLGYTISSEITDNGNTKITLSNSSTSSKTINLCTISAGVKNAIVRPYFGTVAASPVPSVTRGGTTIYGLDVECNDLYVVTGSVGKLSYSEGISYASNEKTHAEGNSIASAIYAHAENMSMAIGGYSHSGGKNSIAKGTCSFAHGNSVRVNGEGYAAFGKYNVGGYPFEIGCGSSDTQRANLFLVNSSGLIKTKNSDLFGIENSGTLEGDTTGITFDPAAGTIIRIHIASWTISTGKVFGHAIREITVPDAPALGTVACTNTALGATSNTGYTITLNADSSITIKCSSTAYRVRYTIERVM